MLAGKTRLVETSTTTGGRRYSRLVVHIPLKIVRDSQFPFKAGQRFRIDVDSKKKTIVLSPL